MSLVLLPRHRRVPASSISTRSLFARSQNGCTCNENQSKARPHSEKLGMGCWICQEVASSRVSRGRTESPPQKPWRLKGQREHTYHEIEGMLFAALALLVAEIEVGACVP